MDGIMYVPFNRLDLNTLVSSGVIYARSVTCAYALKFFMFGRHSLNLAKWTLVKTLFCQIMIIYCVPEL